MEKSDAKKLPVWDKCRKALNYQYARVPDPPLPGASSEEVARWRKYKGKCLFLLQEIFGKKDRTLYSWGRRFEKAPSYVKDQLNQMPLRVLREIVENSNFLKERV